MEHFRTSRLVARDWTRDDVQAAYDIYRHYEVVRWLGEEPRIPVSSLAQMRERVDRWIQRSRDEPDYGLWAIETRTGSAAGAVVGAVLLARLPGPDSEVEIGWHLNPDYWGIGYATEAGRGAAGLAFGVSTVGPDTIELDGAGGRVPLDYVIALVATDNARSRAVCRRLGMTHVGQTDRYYGVVAERFELRRIAEA